MGSVVGGGGWWWLGVGCEDGIGDGELVNGFGFEEVGGETTKGCRA